MQCNKRQLYRGIRKIVHAGVKIDMSKDSSTYHTQEFEKLYLEN
jgi:hypothetical protein